MAHSHRSHPSALLRWCSLLAILTLLVTSASGVVLTAPAAAADPVLYEQTGSRWVFGGSWTTYAAPDLSGGSHALTEAAGSSVSIAFVGTRLDLVGMTGPKFGIVTISVDGGTPVEVDLYSTETLFQQTVFSTGELEDGLHVIRVTCSGSKNTAASDVFVSVDAALITGTPTALPVEQVDLRIVKRGAWVSYSSPGLSGGSHWITKSTGSEIAIAFTGTALDLVGMTGPKFGIASVSIDGGAPVDVDLYAPESHMRQLVFSTGELPGGLHTVRVICTGRNNPAASDRFVGLDAVLPVGTLTQAVIRYEETEPRFGWGGQIGADPGGIYSGGRYAWVGPDWGAVRVAFNGARLDWVATLGPQFGIATVSVDGGPPVDIDLYSPSVLTQRVVFSTGNLPFGQHNVLISWSGRSNPAATNRFVSFDAFDIGGEPVQAAAPTPPPVAITFNYPWARYIVIDKSDLRLYYVVNGVTVVSYPVAVGKPSTPTPSAIWRIDAKYYSSGVFGPRKMRLFRQQGNRFVYTAYNLHGTDTDSSIGTYASHGCIRMHNYDVIPFFDMVPLGTMVVTRD